MKKLTQEEERLKREIEIERILMMRRLKKKFSYDTLERLFNLDMKKAQLLGIRQGKKIMLNDEIEFLKIILKSNNHRKDNCVYHLCSGRLKKLKELKSKI